MTLCLPYWCPKIIKRRPCWCSKNQSCGSRTFWTSFYVKTFFVRICAAAGGVSENALTLFSFILFRNFQQLCRLRIQNPLYPYTGVPRRFISWHTAHCHGTQHVHWGRSSCGTRVRYRNGSKSSCQPQGRYLDQQTDKIGFVGVRCLRTRHQSLCVWSIQL